MSFKGKLFIIMMAIAAIIYFVGPTVTDVKPQQEAVEKEVSLNATEDHHDDEHDHDHKHDYDDDHHEHAEDGKERITHYAVQRPQTAQAALALLKKKATEVGAILGKEKLGSTELEAVHEHSYSLEAAVDKLRAEKAHTSEDSIDNLDEAVQALHYASENHEIAETRQWFAKMQLAISKL